MLLKNEIKISYFKYRTDIIIHDVIKDEKKVIEDLEFIGTGRLILLPLLNKYPFIGGFIFYLNEQLIFCFNSNHCLLSNLNYIESTRLKEFIYEKINQILLNQIYKIHGHLIDENVYHDKTIFHGPILLCYINLIEILNLDDSSLPSNFTYFCLIKIGDNIYQTKSIKNTVSPKFNEIFLFPVRDLYEMLRIKLFARKYENEKSICIGKFKINLPAKEANVNDVDTYLEVAFKQNPLFTGKSFWLPLKVKSQANRIPFIHMKIALMHLTTDCTRLIDHNLDKIIKNQAHLPIVVLNVILTNLQLDYKANKSLPHTNKLTKDQLFRISANFNGNYQIGQHFFLKSNSLIGSKIRDVKFCFIENTFQTTNELSFEIELFNLNGKKDTLPGKVTIKLNDFIANKKYNLMKNITFQLHKLNKANPIIIGTAELYLTIQTVLIHHLVLNNLAQQPAKQDDKTDYLKPQNINSISYYSTYTEKLKKQFSWDDKINEFVLDLHFKTKKDKTLEKELLKQSKLNLTADEKEDTDEKDCEILLAFHYSSNLLLLVDVVRLINCPIISPNHLPNPTLLIEIWRDKSRVAYSLTETKYQTRDPFYSIQIQFEINANKLSNLFLRILILENAKKTFFNIRDKSEFLAETFIKIPELEIGNSSEPKWFKFTKIGLYGLE